MKIMYNLNVIYFASLIFRNPQYIEGNHRSKCRILEKKQLSLVGDSISMKYSDLMFILKSILRVFFNML